MKCRGTYPSDQYYLHISVLVQARMGLSHTSRTGTGSSELLSNFTVAFIAETKNSAATTRNNPELSSKNDDRADFHRFEMVCRGACLGRSNGDVSSGMSAPSRGDSNPDDNDAH